MRKLLSLLFVCLLGGPAVLSGRAQTNDADQDVLIRAMKAELARSVDNLKLADLEKPYFIEFTLDDAEVYNAGATFGALTGAGRFPTGEDDFEALATMSLMIGLAMGSWCSAPAISP